MNQIFRLKDILYGIRKYLSVIIGTTLGGLMLGIVIYAVQSLSASNEVSYQVFSSFSVSTPNDMGIYFNGTNSPGSADLEAAPDLIGPISYICRSEKVCGQVVKNLNLIGVTTKSVQKALTLTQYGKTSIVEITLLWKDENEGLRIMNEVLNVLPSAIREVLTVGEVRIIEGPVVTTITTHVGTKVVLMLAGLGLALGLLYCFSQLYMHPTLIEIKDVGDLLSLNMLEQIGEEPKFDEFLNDNLITNRASLPAAMKESYTALAHILLHQVEQENFGMFVTSATRGEGKTTVTANLGIELAALDKRVLLIDFDLNSPSLGSFFLDDIDYKNTLNAVYFDDASIREAIIRINENLHLLPARLDKRHMAVDHFAKKLVAEMEGEYDIVLIDTAPVGEASEALYFSNVTSNALFVIRYDYASVDAIEESLEKMSKTNTNIQGAVVNCVPQMGVMGVQEDEKAAKAEKKAHKAKKKPTGKKNRYELDLPDDFDSDDDLRDSADDTAVQSAPEVTAERRSLPYQQDDDDDGRQAALESTPIPRRDRPERHTSPVPKHEPDAGQESTSEWGEDRWDLEETEPEGVEDWDEGPEDPGP